MQNWRERISVNPAVCHGRACVRGTRVLVSVIVDNVAAGVLREELLRNYAALTDPDIDAALAYAADLTREGTVDFAAGNQSLKFKVDENLPTEYASILRGSGFEADTVSDEKLSGAADSVSVVVRKIVC